MRNIVIGTAGHIDHGKTSLVKALTGIDTDRLKEEKSRGITIEIGFAHLSLPAGTVVSIIDVPGHERFIKNMLAGVAGIDLALLVIAADEGVMPQTREHLEILTLLEVKGLIAVITKIDLVDQEMLDLVVEETKDILGEYGHKNAPCVFTSANTKQGLQELIRVIEKSVENLQVRRETNGPARLPIDRVFSMQGFGTVVTGTLFNGEIKVGQELELPLKDKFVRIRSLQVHKVQVESAYAGQRVAVNLTGVDKVDIIRGDVLASPGIMQSTSRIDVSCHLLKSCPWSMKHMTRIRFHQGTREILGRISLLEREIMQPGEEAFFQLILEEPAVFLRGDRYIIRSYYPLHTIGGGVIIEPYAVKHGK